MLETDVCLTESCILVNSLINASQLKGRLNIVVNTLHLRVENCLFGPQVARTNKLFDFMWLHIAYPELKGHQGTSSSC